VRPVGGTAVGERTCELRSGVGRSAKSALTRDFSCPDTTRDEACGAGCDQEQRETGEDDQRQGNGIGVARPDAVEGFLEELALGLRVGRGRGRVARRIGEGLLAARRTASAQLQLPEILGFPAGELLTRVEDVFLDEAVLLEVVRNVLDRLPVAVQRVRLVDLLVVEPVVDDLAPARRFGSRGGSCDGERKRGERSDQQTGGGVPDRADCLSLPTRGARTFSRVSRTGVITR
jgi:hypothetical protein